MIGCVLRMCICSLWLTCWKIILMTHVCQVCLSIFSEQEIQFLICSTCCLYGIYKGKSPTKSPMLGLFQTSEEANRRKQLPSISAKLVSCQMIWIICLKLGSMFKLIPPLIGNPYNGYINPYYWVERQWWTYTACFNGLRSSLEPCWLKVGVLWGIDRWLRDVFPDSICCFERW